MTCLKCFALGALSVLLPLGWGALMAHLHARAERAPLPEVTPVTRLRGRALPERMRDAGL